MSMKVKNKIVNVSFCIMAFCFSCACYAAVIA